jgi:hypothetical protein
MGPELYAKSIKNIEDTFTYGFSNLGNAVSVIINGINDSSVESLLHIAYSISNEKLESFIPEDELNKLSQQILELKTELVQIDIDEQLENILPASQRERYALCGSF